MRDWRMLAAAGLIVLLAACGGTREGPAPTARQAMMEATAKVEAVNAERRELMLLTEDGRYLTVRTGPEVRNFDQIEVGDTVRAVFVESVAVEMATGPGGGDGESAVLTRVPPGERPAGAVAQQVRRTVEIVSYDQATGLATFTTADGATHSIIVDPAMRDFAEQLQPGDRVDVRYTTAIAVAVEETAG